MTKTEFLVNGHIREYYDARELDESSKDLIWRIRKRMRECESLNIPYEDYVDKDCLLTVLEQLDCCIRNKDRLQRKREVGYDE